MKTMSLPRLSPQWLCNSCTWTQVHDDLKHLIYIYIYICIYIHVNIHIYIYIYIYIYITIFYEFLLILYIYKTFFKKRYTKSKYILFWSRYTGLGSQTHSPKRSKVLISGISFRQRSMSQSQESNVLSCSERKIATNFQGFAPEPHWGELTVPPQTPWLHNGFSPRYARRKTGTPTKMAGYFPANWNMKSMKWERKRR